MVAWQKVIFRNYGIVPNAAIARAIGTDEKTVQNNAVLLGLEKIRYQPDWRKKGFVTIIRNNWDLLPNADIAMLLNITEKELERLLREYDFLGVKMGEKPQTDKATYAPLTSKEQEATKKIHDIVAPVVRPPAVQPFDFFAATPEPVYLPPEAYAVTHRFTSAYCVDYGNALTDDTLGDYSDDMLSRLAKTGVNGIWLHETLRNLAAFPFDTAYSTDHTIRVHNLRKLTERCKKYGIGVYLYLNEPRSLPAEFFAKHPQLRGQACEGGHCLCTSSPEVQAYLYEALKSVAQAVPMLEGVLTITMSENPTHCYSNKWDGKSCATHCARCAIRAPEEVAAQIDNIFARALKDGNGHTRLIANLWGWSDFMGWTEDMVMRGLALLDKDVAVMCVSEYSKKFSRGGIQSEVIDYSVSVVGPSDTTVKLLSLAKKTGHEIWAKIQINTSWECAGVPYIPVFDLMVRHVENVKRLGVSGCMMGWSLGGFPGGALPLSNMACGENYDEAAWYDETYAENAALTKECVGIFCRAFQEFPFSLSSLYFGGQNLACANLWSLSDDARRSSMVCFTFDDAQTWSAPYGLDIYILQMQKLTEQWKVGLEKMQRCTGNAAFEECKRMASACYIHFSAAGNLAEFTKRKQNVPINRQEILQCLRSEAKITAWLYALIGQDAKIGYEATNHYFYTANGLLEKLVNLHDLQEEVAL